MTPSFVWWNWKLFLLLPAFNEISDALEPATGWGPDRIAYLKQSRGTKGD